MSTNNIQQVVHSHTKYAHQLFESALFADCIVYSNNKNWHLHRAILAQRCEFFRACFSNDFRESRPTSQAGLVEVEMHEDDSEAVGRMLRWLYTLEYPLLESEHPDLADSFWTSELLLFAIADKYDLFDLVDKAATSICDATKLHIQQANLHNECSREKSCFDDFTNMLEMLYIDVPSASSSVRSLQEKLIRLSALSIAAQTSKQPRLLHLITAVPGFAEDLVEALRQIAEISGDVKTDSVTNAKFGSESNSTRTSSFSDPWAGNRSDVESDGSGQSPGRSTIVENNRRRQYIPMNEDSDED